MRGEVFYLAYHLHWSYRDILDLPVSDRAYYVRMLSERITADNEAWEKLNAR